MVPSFGPKGTTSQTQGKKQAQMAPILEKWAMKGETNVRITQLFAGIRSEQIKVWARQRNMPLHDILT